MIVGFKIVVLYDVTLCSILAEKHDNSIVLGEIQYIVVVACDTVEENITKMFFWMLIPNFSAIFFLSYYAFKSNTYLHI